MTAIKSDDMIVFTIAKLKHKRTKEKIMKKDYEKLIKTVDENGNYTGWIKKFEAHEKGVLHKAFSIFIHDGKGNMLIQKRAAHKYHSPNLWTNACCSHSSEKYMDLKTEAECRLLEEMGFTVPIKKLFDFKYHEKVGDLTENEHDTVFIGVYDKEVTPNPDEASECKYVPFNEILKDIKENPDNYSVWFKIVIERVIEMIR